MRLIALYDFDPFLWIVKVLGDMPLLRLYCFTD